MGIHDLWLFMIAGVLLNITPGPDMALIAARSTQHGTRVGIAAALGIGAGALVHIAAAAIGISALIAASALAFALVKLLGALYLLYVGARMIWTSFPGRPPSTVSIRSTSTNLGSFFVQGFLTNLLNPKVAVFFLAFLPQFISDTAPLKPLAFILLGLLFNVTGTIWNVLVAVLVARISGTPAFERTKVWFERLVGALFVGVGVKLALSDRP